MKIVPLNRYLEFAETAVDWFVNEWGSSRQSVKDVLLDNKQCPPALVAMDPGRPMGFLGYNIHMLKPRGSSELWINALYVAPEFRHRGIGSQLVREATNAAADSNRDSLFVYTDIPTFYESLGRKRFSYVEESEMHILEYKLRSTATTTLVAEDT